MTKARQVSVFGVWAALGLFVSGCGPSGPKACDEPRVLETLEQLYDTLALFPDHASFSDVRTVPGDDGALSCQAHMVSMDGRKFLIRYTLEEGQLISGGQELLGREFPVPE